MVLVWGRDALVESAVTVNTTSGPIARSGTEGAAGRGPAREELSGRPGCRKVWTKGCSLSKVNSHSHLDFWSRAVPSWLQPLSGTSVAVLGSLLGLSSCSDNANGGRHSRAHRGV